MTVSLDTTVQDVTYQTCPGFHWPKEYCPTCGGELPNGCECS